jgi:hypothetical protein
LSYYDTSISNMERKKRNRKPENGIFQILSVRVTFAEYELYRQYCEDNGMPLSEPMKIAVKECIQTKLNAKVKRNYQKQ